MRIRKLLQTKIWGKVTLRKLIVRVGLVLVVAVIGYGGWSFTSPRWITPHEHKLARAALVELASLDDTDSAGKQEFAAKEKLAATKMNAAFNAALTIRDKEVVGELMHYQLLIISNRLLGIKQSASLPAGAVLNSLSSQNKRSLRANLQHELD